ncbi:MAG: L,D-transpeptidase [Cyanobacteria bacterium J06643_4]
MDDGVWFTTARLGRRFGIVALGVFVFSGVVLRDRTALATAVELPEPSEVAEPSAADEARSLSAASVSSRDLVAPSVLSLELRLGERRLLVYSGEMLLASYDVAIGREGWNTPTGEFSVLRKQTNPAWEHPFTGEVVQPGPDNPLGTRWIGFWTDGQNSIGFHGTPDESVIGSAVSHGCVRMRNEDIVALYEQVSVDTVVRVIQ